MTRFIVAAIAAMLVLPAAARADVTVNTQADIDDGKRDLVAQQLDQLLACAPFYPFTTQWPCLCHSPRPSQQCPPNRVERLRRQKVS